MELCKDFPKVVDALAKNAPKGKVGGDRKSKEAKANHAILRSHDLGRQSRSTAKPSSKRNSRRSALQPADSGQDLLGIALTTLRS